ncbi:HEAT repeat protein [Aspergillus japonicus CBS 114.51]|uniref:HEAT repeat protein n=1 Tax=Aspergillus japonicus CBS 114.51 TaxID=1448312 RepID=A0A8T8XF48_ASPJA|nr:HEAT repeat protein [Aspergillus japonicus CBS 114.51]RAH86710.1 HEAT repeat protein [Aspergillus japonicus CBS 114.51]
MEISRQEAFTKLKPPCVELSAVGLRFRGSQASPNDVFKALKSVYAVLNELGNKDALDEKLAEYAFFPLCHIFNETQRTPVNSLELAVKCLQVLIEKGWRRRLSPQMGKQLMILLTLIVGGAPSKANGNHPAQARPAELSITGFNCLSAIFNVLEGPEATATIYHEVGTATVVDQTVYVLLEGISDDQSGQLCISAAESLIALYRRITDRVVLASIMPRTVSTLTKVIRPTTQTRRSYKLLSLCLQILTYMLRTVLNDRASKVTEKQDNSQKPDDPLVLDASWLKATATQIKLALANIIQVRRHERPEVQTALRELCLMVVEDCQATLQESLPIIVETLIVLSDEDDKNVPNEAFTALTHHATTYPVVVDNLRNSLHTWITSFPRTMQGNDETAKQWAVRQISTAFQVLSQVQSSSDILESSLASGICDSVAAAVNHTMNTLQPLSASALQSQNMEVLHHGSSAVTFEPVLMEHKSQRDTLRDLRTMIVRLGSSESGNGITRLIVNRIYQEHGDALISPMWLSLKFLTSNLQATSAFDDFISLDELEPSGQLTTRAGMIEELYYIALPVLNEPLANDSRDWRVQALALEAVALQAQQLGEAFRPELMDALYPVLQLLASSNSSLQRHAMTCLNLLTDACNYPDASTMVIENVDYLVNSVALKLNTFDVSPYPPQVLLMMVKLCGARLIPYLDDLVDSIFGILDMYHGYPKLVELMFRTLAAIVDEGTKTPAMLAISDGKGSTTKPDHRKKRYESLLISTLAQDFAQRRAKRAKLTHELPAEPIAHPRKPWKSSPQDEQTPPTEFDNTLVELENDESDEPLPAPKEPEDGEKPLSKPHTLLLHIVRSIPSYLTSPSPYLRHSLLTILTDVFPTLSPNENSFLPLINDLWPTLAARICFPSSPITTTTSSPTTATTSKPHSTPTALTLTTPIPPENPESLEEETYVTTTACHAIRTLCHAAGDFLASRVESEFPRWERLYRQTWTKVRHDAEKALERRSRQHQPQPPHTKTILDVTSPENQTHPTTETPKFHLTQSLSLHATSARTFTPHHAIWRGLLPLFITLLTHVRLPLKVGDAIARFVVEWLVLFAAGGGGGGGVEVYELWLARQKSSDGGVVGGRVGGGGEDQTETKSADLRSIEEALEALETWNADLTWFLFQEHRARGVGSNTKKTAPRSGPLICEVVEEPLKEWTVPGKGLRFAELSF